MATSKAIIIMILVLLLVGLFLVHHWMDRIDNSREINLVNDFNNYKK